METVKTPPIAPNGKWNKSEKIFVGKCDQGPLTYTVQEISGVCQMCMQWYVNLYKNMYMCLT